MKLKTLLKEILNKSYEAYHGSSTIFPFENFDISMDGTGIVSQGTKYGGFFFTSEKENAEYYTEYFVAEVKIDNVYDSPIDSSHSPTVLKQAISDNKSYLITDIMDGDRYSDIIVVPKGRLQDIKIVKWEFVGDEDYLFERYDKLFGAEEEEDDDEGGVYVSQDSIEETVSMIDLNLDYLLSIPIFKKYYDSK